MTYTSKKIIILCAFVAGFAHLTLLHAQTAGQNAPPFRERIYISVDKPVYIAGETVWMSLFCFDAATHRLSNLSSVAYIELQDQQRSLIQVKAAMLQGRGGALITLPQTLPTGNYRIVAYTRYMQNESPDVFYSRVVSVYNTLSTERAFAEGAFQRTESSGSPSSDMVPVKIEVASNKNTFLPRSAIPMTITNQSNQPISYSISIYGIDSLPGVHNPDMFHHASHTNSLGGFRNRFVADLEGEVIRGKVINSVTGAPQSPKPESNAFLSVVGPNIEVYNGKIDANGNVAFFTPSVSGAHEVVTEIYPNDGQLYRIVLDNAFADVIPAPLPDLPVRPTMEPDLQRRSLSMQIESRFQSNRVFTPATSVYATSFNYPGKTYKLDEYTRFPTMREVITEFVSEARFRPSGGQMALFVRYADAFGRISFSQEKSLVIIDGIPIFDHNKVLNYDPTLLERLDVYEGFYAFGSVAFAGIAAFSSFTGLYPEIIFEENVRISAFKGVLAPLTFSAPEYSNTLESARTQPDWRHTLYWNANMVNDAGSAQKIICFSSDYTGEFIAVIEGLTSDGQQFRKTCRFIVSPL